MPDFPTPPFRRATARAAAAVCIAVAGAASAGGPPAPVPESPAREVPLPAQPPAAPATQPAIPEALLKPGATITMAQVVEIALENNPLTRTSFLQARSAAALLGSKKAPYYPTVGATASFTRSNNSVQDPVAGATIDTYGPAVTLNYLLLDLGGRAANVEDARLGLIAADWTHNATVQNVILGVETAYVEYLNAKAQLEAATVNVRQAQAALDAATARHDAGLATIAEVLQAKTALSQAVLAQQSADGAVLALRGALATAMGLPANTPYDVGRLPSDVPLDHAAGAVEDLIATARLRRPDLEASRALAAKATAHIRSVRSDGLPTLSLSATGYRTYFDPSFGMSYGNYWSAAALVTIPLFTGFANTYNIRQAVADAGVAQAQADSLDQQVILEVWQSYYSFKTATQLVKTSRDLLASAEESERVALGRYKEGVGTIIDVLTAQAALANARAEEIVARSSWYVTLAQLAHDTGTIPPLDQPIEITKKGTDR
jgi:outer membrane protein TolC